MSDEPFHSGQPPTDGSTGAETEQPAADSDAARGVSSPSASERETELEQQAQDNWNKYLRSVAEMDNLRKRSARDLENARKYGTERLATAILPVRDSIEAGLRAASAADIASLDVQALLDGERATLRLLDQALEAVSIEEIDPQGEPFDPEMHEAISMLVSTTAEPGSVLEVIQKGYRLHERVVRPARVIVAQEPPEAGEQ